MKVKASEVNQGVDFGTEPDTIRFFLDLMYFESQIKRPREALSSILHHPGFSKSSEHRALIGLDMKLEMKKRHRTATMGYTMSVEILGHEANCGYSLPVAVNQMSFWRRFDDKAGGDGRTGNIESDKVSADEEAKIELRNAVGPPGAWFRWREIKRKTDHC
jgi:hypothetical protein